MNLFEKEKLLSNPLYFIAVNGVPDPEKENAWKLNLWPISALM